MASLNYEFITNFYGYVYVYVFELKQFYEKNVSHPSATNYRCKYRKCHNSIKIVNNICTSVNNTPHKKFCIKNWGEKKYNEMKFETFITKKIKEDPEKSMDQILKENNIKVKKSLKHKLYRIRLLLTDPDGNKSKSNKPMVKNKKSKQEKLKENIVPNENSISSVQNNDYQQHTKIPHSNQEENDSISFSNLFTQTFNILNELDEDDIMVPNHTNLQMAIEPSQNPIQLTKFQPSNESNNAVNVDILFITEHYKSDENVFDSQNPFNNAK